MRAVLSRRAALAGAAWLPLGGRAAAVGPFARLEQRSLGRLGVAILDTASLNLTGHRIDERFGLCSTVKLLLAACVLARVDAGQMSLDAEVAYDPARLPAHAPVSAAHRSLSIGALCGAAIALSDNGAANLLFDRLGGPPALTGWLRGIGDGVTRSDRIELALNDQPAGEQRDTTTPAAMAATMRGLLTGDLLSGDSRRILADWMSGCRTGDRRLRAGLPAGWRVGDKTGTGSGAWTGRHRGALLADVAICYPPDRAPLIVTAWVDTPLARPQAEAVLAEVGRIASGPV